MSRAAGGERGQSLVEFALILPLFVVVLLGIFDVGRAIYAYNTINNAARQAARLAIVDQTTDHIKERAAAHAVSLGVAEDDVYVDFRLSTTPDDEESCGAFVADGTPDSETSGIQRCLAFVQVPYTYAAATPVIGQLIGPLTLVGESAFKLEFYCEGAACPIGD